MLSSENTADMPDEEVLAAGVAGVGPLGWNRLPGGGGGGAAGPPLEGPVPHLLSANAMQTSKRTVRPSNETPNAAELILLNIAVKRPGMYDMVQMWSHNAAGTSQETHGVNIIV